jgi:hypothetical protein
MINKKGNKNLYSVRFRHINNCVGIEKEIFEKRIKILKNNKYLGFIEEKTFITKDGKIIIESYLIPLTPINHLRKRMLEEKKSSLKTNVSKKKNCKKPIKSFSKTIRR